MTEFGSILKELRLALGLTQKQLAERLSVSKMTVSYYEQSIRCPSSDILIKLSQIFHVSVDYLLGGNDKRQTLDVTDLPVEDIEFLKNAVTYLRKKNNDINNAPDNFKEKLH